jgi:hypothetical protein
VSSKRLGSGTSAGLGDVTSGISCVFMRLQDIQCRRSEQGVYRVSNEELVISMMNYI